MNLNYHQITNTLQEPEYFPTKTTYETRIETKLKTCQD